MGVDFQLQPVCKHATPGQISLMHRQAGVRYLHKCTSAPAGSTVALTGIARLLIARSAASQRADQGYLTLSVTFAIASGHCHPAQCPGMSLKLFRSTEFAQSRSFSPEAQRRALHPFWLLVAAGFWIAVPGNWALWAALARTPGLETGATVWIGLRIALLIGVASTGLLCLVMWRRTTKLAVSLALVATAMAGLPGSLASGLLPWQAVLCVLVVAVAPCVWLWRKHLQRLSLWRNLRVIASSFVACGGLFALVLVVSVTDLTTLHAKAPTLRKIVSPYSGSGTLAALEKILLRRQP